MPVTINGTTGVAGVNGSAGTPAIQGGTATAGVFYPAANTVAISTSSAEAMRVDSSGNVGIGTSSPSYRLDAQTTATGTAAGDNTAAYFGSLASGRDVNIRLGDSVNATARIGYLSGALYMYVNGAERARIDTSGNLLVGTTNTSESAGNGLKLLVGSTPGFKVVTPASTASSASFMSYSSGASAYRFYVTDAGVVNATSTSITAISDASLKENIRDLDTGLAQVMALRPRRFDWKEETQIDEKGVAGFIAQEVEAVLPELVYEYKYSEDVTKKSLKMGDILPTLVKAIQEQQALIESLTARIAALEGAK